MTLGEYGTLTPDQARREATRLRGEVAAGRCPATAKKVARDARAARRSAATVNDLFDAFLAESRAKKKAATVSEYDRMFRRDIRPRLGARKAADVTFAQIAKVHLDMAGRPYLANRALAAMHAAFAFAERHEMRPRGSNPCAEVEPYPETARERFLSEAEFAALGAALTRASREGLPPPPTLRRKAPKPEMLKHRSKSADVPRPANPIAVAALRFLLLSGWRESEALTLRWEFLNVERSHAMLPKTKTGRSIRPLGAAVWALLSTLPRVADSPYVFPGAKPGEPLKELKRVWGAVRHAAGLDTVRLHDLRHSHASVGVGDLGLSLPILAALLGHAEVATTQRYAHLADDPRKRAADAVAGRVAALLAANQGGEASGETHDRTTPLRLVRGA
jgi:integrase